MKRFKLQVSIFSIVLTSSLLFSYRCDNESDKIADIYSVPKDVDSTTLLNNDFQAIRDDDFFDKTNEGKVLYFYKAAQDLSYSIQIVLRDGNSKGIMQESITLNKKMFEDVTGKEFKNYKRIKIGTSKFKAETSKTQHIHLERIDL